MSPENEKIEVRADGRWDDFFDTDDFFDVSNRNIALELQLTWVSRMWARWWQPKIDEITYRGPIRELAIKPLGVYIREGSYFPEHLGLNMPGVNWIHVGRCSQKANKGYDAFGNEVAHAHHDIGEICFPHGTCIFSAPGVADDTLIHEYCHILAGKEGHGPEWAFHMARYGFDDYPYSSHVYR